MSQGIIILLGLSKSMLKEIMVFLLTIFSFDGFTKNKNILFEKKFGNLEKPSDHIPVLINIED